MQQLPTGGGSPSPRHNRSLGLGLGVNFLLMDWRRKKEEEGASGGD